jgi:hypothetical protein
VRVHDRQQRLPQGARRLLTSWGAVPISGADSSWVACRIGPFTYSRFTCTPVATAIQDVAPVLSTNLQALSVTAGTVTSSRPW